MNRLKHFWDKSRTSFWFVPMIIVTCSISLAVGLIGVDSSANAEWLLRWPRIFNMVAQLGSGTGADGARGMLSTIAGSMMTVVGVTFSMTLMALALASGQYTSRILRNFMRDSVTQVVLGIFAGIFVYCLIVLRTIRSGDGREFVPGLAVSFSVVLATASIGALIFFIHHVAASIQASSIIASVAQETFSTVDRLFPIRVGDDLDEEDNAVPSCDPVPELWQTVLAKRNGYIESLDEDALLDLAVVNKTVVRVERRIGGFVVEGSALVAIAMNEAPNEECTLALQAAFGIRRHRTPQQDCAFGIRQIVDIALRALSPSTNDTTTAIMCIDYLAAILARLAARTTPKPRRYHKGELRLMVQVQNFNALAAAAFDQIRASAAGNAAIMLRLLGALETIAAMTHDSQRRFVLKQQLEEIAELAARTIDSTHDLKRLHLRLAHCKLALHQNDFGVRHIDASLDSDSSDT